MKNGWLLVTHLDDPQLRAKLVKASSDMPHVDLWARLQAQAAQVSEEAQVRQRGPRFSIFSGLRLLAPAFVLHGVVIWGATAMVLAEFLALTGWQGPQRS